MRAVFLSLLLHITCALVVFNDKEEIVIQHRSGYGPSLLNTEAITAELVVATPWDLCTAPALNYSGLIVIASRGVCDYYTKTMNAQHAGAVALIIGNNLASAQIALITKNDTFPDPTIPTVLIRRVSLWNLLRVYTRGMRGELSSRGDLTAPNAQCLSLVTKTPTVNWTSATVYPIGMTSDAHCNWTLLNTPPDDICPNGSLIEVLFQPFELNRDMNEYVVIRDNNTLINQRSGHGWLAGPGYQYAVGNMGITYVREWYDMTFNTGLRPNLFTFIYRRRCYKTPVEGQCPPIYDPAVLQNPSGVNLTFENATQNLKDSRCGWIFTNNDTTCQKPVVQLYFTEFHFATNEAYVKIFDGDSPLSKRLGTWSGSLRPGGVSGLQRSSNRSISVNIVAGMPQANVSFVVQYLCADNLAPLQNDCPSIDNPLVLSSRDNRTAAARFVDYNESEYSTDLECAWLVKNDNPEVIGCTPVVQINFTRFHLSNGTKDRVVIYDDDEVIESWRLGAFYGLNSPGFRRSSDRPLLITFLSDPSRPPPSDPNYPLSSFRFTYEFVCLESALPVRPVCPEPHSPSTIEDGQLAIAKEQYQNFMDCEWILHNPNPATATCTPVVGINFTVFSLEYLYDYVQLFDGPTDDWFLQIGLFSGTENLDTPGFQFSLGNEMLVHFHSDESTTADGFAAEITYPCLQDIPLVDFCSPLEPWQSFGYGEIVSTYARANASCWWNLTASHPDCRVDATIVEIDVSPRQHLGFYDGSKRIKLPGLSQAGKNFTSSGRSMLVSFSSETESSTTYGWTIRWKSICAPSPSPTGGYMSAYLYVYFSAGHNVTQPLDGTELGKLIAAVAEATNWDPTLVSVHSQSREGVPGHPEYAYTVVFQFGTTPHTEERMEEIIKTANRWVPAQLAPLIADMDLTPHPKSISEGHTSTQVRDGLIAGFVVLFVLGAVLLTALVRRRKPEPRRGGNRRAEMVMSDVSTAQENDDPSTLKMLPTGKGTSEDVFLETDQTKPQRPPVDSV